MSHYYPNPKYPYGSGPSYAPCFFTAPMNYTYEYSSSGNSESSSSAYTADSSNHSGCLSAALPSDLPDLYYDQYELPSPPSATSSNMISTPPLDWAQPWVSIETKPASYQQEPWQSSPLVSERPMVHPTDTHCNWIYQQQQSGALEPSSILFRATNSPTRIHHHYYLHLRMRFKRNSSHPRHPAPRSLLQPLCPCLLLSLFHPRPLRCIQPYLRHTLHR
ncbi:hypothetical protein BJ912DRAFT_218614 [Pholiota molesta]|nr:hypothetical protein BJ912DRAFT_218614 [Pholiota molesta]